MQSGFVFTIVNNVEHKYSGNINQRIKKLRKTLNMTQVSFSQVIALSSGYLAGIETEKRKVNNRLIKLICSSFNVNEQWLKNGEGEIFSSSENNEKYIKLVGLFKELEPQFQYYIFKEIGLLLRIQEEQSTEPGW